MSNSTVGIDARLTEWGLWKRTYLIGLGNEESGGHTIESQVIEGVIFGDGCKGGGRKKGSDNSVQFKDNDEAEQVEYCLKLMMMSHRQHAATLMALYMFEWTTLKIAQSTNTTRYYVTKNTTEAKLMLQGLLMTCSTAARRTARPQYAKRSQDYDDSNDEDFELEPD